MDKEQTLKIEEKELNIRSNRYQQNIDSSKADICRIDPLPILYTLQSKLQSNVCLCERRPICECLEQNKCNCDSDLFVDIQSVKMDLASNCTFICEFISKQDKLTFLNLNHKIETNKKKRQIKTTIRIFTLDKADKEEILMDIVRNEGYVQLYTNENEFCRFDIIEMFVQDYSLIVKLNYMSMILL